MSAGLGNRQRSTRYNLFEAFPLRVNERNPTLRINDKEDSRNARSAALPPRAITAKEVFSFELLGSTPKSILKNGPSEMYTAWMMMESDMAKSVRVTKELIRGRTEQSEWKISPTSERQTRVSGSSWVMRCHKMTDTCPVREKGESAA